MNTLIYKPKHYVCMTMSLFISLVLFSFSSSASAAESNCTVWVKNQPYSANICVSYNNKFYKTQWWADAGVAPFIGANSWDSPWVLVEGTIAPPPPPTSNPACPVWVNNKSYPEKLCVTYNNKTYKTQWWANAGIAPFIGKNAWDSPWVLGSVTPPPPTTPPGKPIVASIGDSSTKQVGLKWSLTGTAKGTSWSVTDKFNNVTTTIFPTSTTFGAQDTATLQMGTAALTLDNGQHSLIVVLCNTPSVCTSSDPMPVKVNAVAVMPGVPVLQPIPGSTHGQLTVNWSTVGNAGSYWTLQKDDTELQRYTTFIDATKKSGTVSMVVDSGTNAYTVKLCNEDSECTTSNAQIATISGAPEKISFFMAYYPTWFAPFHDAFCADGRNCSPGPNAPVADDAVITRTSLLAGGVPDYVTHVMLAFAKLNQMHNYGGISKVSSDLGKLGLSLITSSASLKESIRVLKLNNPGTKVILALGGASYNDSWNNVTAADVSKLTQLIVDLGLDGLDVDYEVGGVDTANINKYYDSIVKMRQAIDSANAQTGKKAILTLAGWSTGADCTAQTQGIAYPECKGKVSYFGGNAGRERLVLKGKGASSMIDGYGVMSYDAGYTHFDPIVAYNQYKALAKPGAIVAIGIQVSPDEGWGKAITFVDDKGVGNDNPCKGDLAGNTLSDNTAGGNTPGNIILWDQYGTPKPGTFSVKRFAGELSKNPGDGFMMWSLFAGRAPTSCGGIPVSTVTELGQAVSQYMHIGTDRTKKIDKHAADIYGR